jgi:S-adenosylmethionine:tRNA ribosyltransferase-isomerase
MSDLDAYHYDLPKQLIAQQPLARRSDARLLVVDRKTGAFAHRHVRDLDEILSPGDCLVANDTRVVPARLVGHRRDTSGHWEGLFLTVDDRGTWQLLCKTRGKLQPGEIITLEDPAARDDVGLRLVTKLDDGVWAARPESAESVWQILDRVGRVPLPPYIRGGEMVDADRQQYQTVFAREPGAVAAPTAGLHFTDDLLRKLAARGITSTYVTLHVGLDTFRPIAVDSLADHPMHSEWGQIGADAVQRILECRQRGGRIVAVGTTSVRVLETAAATGTLQPWSGNTNLFIRPPHTFQAVDALLTNFHLPRTTLLVLVYTFGGAELIRRAYEEAIKQEYRFYSYGDAMLIL